MHISDVRTHQLLTMDYRAKNWNNIRILSVIYSEQQKRGSTSCSMLHRSQMTRLKLHLQKFTLSSVWLIWNFIDQELQMKSGFWSKVQTRWHKNTTHERQKRELWIRAVPGPPSYGKQVVHPEANTGSVQFWGLKISLHPTWVHRKTVKMNKVDFSLGKNDMNENTCWYSWKGWTRKTTVCLFSIRTIFWHHFFLL